jgi:gamma-glutamyltranspeptidase/glutathione hydrolase
VPQDVRDQLTAMGHKLDVKPLRTPTFGYGQAVMFDRKSGVKFGASDPRHDGEAVPATAPYFTGK